MANAEEIQGQTRAVRAALKERWGQLTDDDLALGSVGTDQLIGQVQQKTGEARRTIEDFLTELTSRGAASVAQMAGAAGALTQDAAQGLTEGYERVLEQAREGYRQAEDLVRKRPGTSLAVSLGVGVAAGLVIGLLLRSR